MDSAPRKWVLRPLSPSLQPSDLRSISSQRDGSVFFSDSISIVGGQSAVYVEGLSESSVDVVVAGRQVSVSQDDAHSSRSSSSSEDLPLSPCSSSSGASHSGFYSFVDDPFSPEAERNEAWMVSPQRQTQLATLREENSYKLQSYSGQRRPGNLFHDEGTDLQYRIEEKYEVVGEREERQLRREIIRDQAHKKSPLVEHDGGGPFGNDTGRLIEGLSISYSHIDAKPNVVTESEVIDEEQINFDAARKQFLQMEQNKLDPIIRPRKVQVKVTPKQNSSLQDEEFKRKEQVYAPKVDVVYAEPREDQSLQSSISEESEELLQNPVVSFNNNDGLVFVENSAEQLSLKDETPIEREIRIAQEREENLRRSRGLQQSVCGEMVKIKTLRLQSPMPLTPSRAKDKVRVSFNFQEIQRKEEATKQDGGGPRLERAGSYEALEPNSIDNKENIVSRAIETLKESVGEKFGVVDYALQKQSTQGGSYLDNREIGGQRLQEYVEPYLRNARQNQAEENTHTHGQQLQRKVEFEGYKSLEERWQSQSRNGDRIENGYTSVPERSREDSISDDVFLLPCCPHRHADESEVTRRDSPSLQAPSWRDGLERTGLQARGQGAADFIERDIQEALRREQELREQREARATEVYSPQTLVQQADKMAATQFYPHRTDKAQVRLPSSSRPVVRLSGVPLMSPQPWSPAPQTLQTPAPVRTTPLPVRGLTQTLLQDFEERRTKLRLEESAYAGIQPVDSVNNEVVESTRVTRHKNRRALQWEAGLFANQQE